MHLRTAALVIGFGAMLAACHSEMADVPLTNQKIRFTDKFYDVKALSPSDALVVGYGGKILATSDAGKTFTRVESGTDLALYKLAAAGSQVWISGQEGLILHSSDGGKTWQKQESGTKVYLFSIFFLDENHGFAVGDKSMLAETTDGGKTWQARKIETPNEGGAGGEADAEAALAIQDPIFYDIRFADPKVGWIAGEFGHLLKTSDGGQTWTAQQKSLMTPESGIVDPMDLPTFFGEYTLSDKEALAAGLDGRIARTRDGGTSWRFEPMKVEFPLTDPLYQPYVTADGNAWVVGAAGQVVRLPPGQTEWTRADLGMQVYTWLRSVNFADAQNGWMVGGFGTILRTSDGGKSWRLCLG
jgi:photosystem II stability/assembly factor-like uncharacterized protein